METFFILSAVFFVLYILFQGLQSAGEKLNDITRPMRARNLRMKILLLKDASDKLNTRKHWFQTLKNCVRYAKTLKKHI